MFSVANVTQGVRGDDACFGRDTASNDRDSARRKTTQSNPNAAGTRSMLFGQTWQICLLSRASTGSSQSLGPLQSALHMHDACRLVPQSNNCHESIRVDRDAETHFPTSVPFSFPRQYWWIFIFGEICWLVAVGPTTCRARN